MNGPFENDESLRKLLSAWRVDATAPPRFQDGVWERIAMGEKQRSAQNFWLIVLDWIAIRLSRPAVAATCLAIFFFIGASAGFEQGKSKSAKVNSDLKMRYIQMVDPYKAPR